MSGGYLVPEEFVIDLLCDIFEIEAPSLYGPRVRHIDRLVAQQSIWWQWLYKNLWKSKIANFVVLRWPGFPSVLRARNVRVKAVQNRKDWARAEAERMIKEKEEAGQLATE